MKIRRTVPPAAAPIGPKSLLHGFAGIFSPSGYIKKLEGELRAYFGVKHVFPVSSGRAALTVILTALKKLSPGRDEVLLPAYTCYTVAFAVAAAGLKVSLCDIDRETLAFQPGQLEKAITEKTLCVVPTYLFGIPSDIGRLKELAAGRNVFVVEDAAQAMGGKQGGEMLGTIGDAGFFSLGRGKNITCGSGGIIVTNSDRLAGAINEQYGMIERERTSLKGNAKEFAKSVALAIFNHPSLYWLPSGMAFLRLGKSTPGEFKFPVKKLSGMQAGLLRGWQRRLEAYNRARGKNAEFFIEKLGLERMMVCGGPKKTKIPFLRLPLLADGQQMRDGLYHLAAEKRFGISLMYPVPVNELSGLEERFKGSSYPVAKEVSTKLLCLPTHIFLSGRDKRKIVRLLNGLPAEVFCPGPALRTAGCPSGNRPSGNQISGNLPDAGGKAAPLGKN